MSDTSSFFPTNPRRNSRLRSLAFLAGMSGLSDANAVCYTGPCSAARNTVAGAGVRVRAPARSLGAKWNLTRWLQVIYEPGEVWFEPDQHSYIAHLRGV